MSVIVGRRRSGRNLAGGVETLVNDGVPAAIIDFADEALSTEFAPDVLDGMMMSWSEVRENTVELMSAALVRPWDGQNEFVKR